MKMIPKPTKNLHPITKLLSEKPVKFIPISQKELVSSNIQLQQIPLVFGTSKFKILLPIDQHIQINTNSQPKIVTPDQTFMYKIKIPKQIKDSLSSSNPTFIAILVDLTQDDVSAFKVFKQLRLSKEGFLKFGNNKVVLSPMEIFPWISSEKDMDG